MAWNQRYVEFFAYPPGMVTVGRPIADLVRFNVMRSEVEEGRIEVEVKKRLEHLRRGTIYTTRRTIRSRVLELNGRPLPDGGFVTTFSDITDHVAAKDALQEANDTLEDTVEARTAEIVKINQALADAKTAAERANQEKTQFLVAVGHDILQPLSAARLFLTAALESEDRAHRTELMQKLGDSLSATEELIADLYEISKLDHGALEPDFTEVAVAQILDQLAEEVRPLAEAKGLELRYVGSQCFTRTDPSYLRRIVGNFLSNAIKYTRHGKILMGVRPVGDLLRVQVWDTGPGIPSHERSRVFEDFCRLDNARGEVGSGLGLSVVRRMARALGAEVELRSAVGKGSCFSLELPRIRIAGCRPSRVPDHPGWSGDEAQVLYVDDEYANIDALGSLVQTWGCALTGFGEVEEAMAYARAMQPPDVLIVDYQLKDGANGIEVAQRLRRSWNVTVPTLIVTALRGSDVRAKAIGFVHELVATPDRFSSDVRAK
ncbi:MAG: PAS-domain containing protein, partial [Myxococcota bacterium]